MAQSRKPLIPLRKNLCDALSATTTATNARPRCARPKPPPLLLYALRGRYIPVVACPQYIAVAQRKPSADSEYTSTVGRPLRQMKTAHVPVRPLQIAASSYQEPLRPAVETPTPPPVAVHQMRSKIPVGSFVPLILPGTTRKQTRPDAHCLARTWRTPVRPTQAVSWAMAFEAPA